MLPPYQRQLSLQSVFYTFSAIFVDWRDFYVPLGLFVEIGVISVWDSLRDKFNLLSPSCILGEPRIFSRRGQIPKPHIFL